MKYRYSMIRDFSLNKINNKRYIYPIVLMFIVLIMLLCIEYKHPYFFLNDDNRDSYLPYFIHNYDSLLNGEIALYNFHQFLGSPSLATGQAATLYPITYISVFLSKLLFGHYFGTIEIEVFIHLMIGAVGFYRFVRLCGVERNISLFGGLTWSLSSFVIYVSNSWVVVSAVTAYFPWMLFFSFCLFKNPKLSNFIYVILVRLFLFYTGNVQFFIYSVFFETLTTLLYVISDTEKYEKPNYKMKFLILYFFSYINVLALSLPLLMPMWNLTTTSAERSGRIAFDMFGSRRFNILELLNSMLLPGQGINGYLNYMGLVVPYFILSGIHERFIKKNKIINLFKWYVILIPLLISLLWSTSKTFNYFIYYIPILNRFRWPFKVTIFFEFYIILMSTIFFYNMFLKYYSNKYKKILIWMLLTLHLINLLYLYIKIPYNFGTHLDKIPLEEEFKGELSNGRIVSLGFEIWSSSSDDTSNFISAPSLGFNYATLFGLQHFAGYNSLLPITNTNATLGLNFKAIIDSIDSESIDYFRRAGVKWYVVSKSSINKYFHLLNNYDILKKYEDENRVIFYDENAFPMVFSSILKNSDINYYKMTTNTLQVVVDLQKSDTIIFNNIFNPYFEGYIDGNKAVIKDINGIHFGLYVPEGKHNISIIYNDSYFNFGIYFSVLFVLLEIVLYYFYIRRIKYE